MEWIEISIIIFFFWQAKKAATLAGKDGNIKKKGVVAAALGKPKEQTKLDKPSLIPVINLEQPRVTRARTKSLKGNEEPPKLEAKAVEVPKPIAEATRVLKDVNTKPVARVTRRSKSITNKQNEKNESTTSGEESLYQTAYSSPVLEASPSL